jgi:hypothetical protein
MVARLHARYPEQDAWPVISAFLQAEIPEHVAWPEMVDLWHAVLQGKWGCR